MRPPPQEPADAIPPAPCPFCRSPKVTTASEKVDALTYWRCEACGEMWNVARLSAAANRHNYTTRWK